MRGCIYRAPFGFQADPRARPTTITSPSAACRFACMQVRRTRQSSGEYLRLCLTSQTRSAGKEPCRSACSVHVWLA
ncbi:hypothetical protein M3J09_002204 [Ascochyta lentis]